MEWDAFVLDGDQTMIQTRYCPSSSLYNCSPSFPSLSFSVMVQFASEIIVPQLPRLVPAPDDRLSCQTPSDPNKIGRSSFFLNFYCLHHCPHIRISCCSSSSALNGPARRCRVVRGTIMVDRVVDDALVVRSRLFSPSSVWTKCNQGGRRLAWSSSFLGY
jgi:hypothetical protein